MEEDSELKNIQKKIDSLEELSRNQQEGLRAYEKEVNDMRRQIQVIGASINKELKQSSYKTKFIKQRKKVEQSPCK